jgi:hypothetical protein
MAHVLTCDKQYVVVLYISTKACASAIPPHHWQYLLHHLATGGLRVIAPFTGDDHIAVGNSLVELVCFCYQLDSLWHRRQEA